MEYDWTTADGMDLVHQRLIAASGFGEVHQVTPYVASANFLVDQH
jgi:hypothetical protein